MKKTSIFYFLILLVLLSCVDDDKPKPPNLNSPHTKPKIEKKYIQAPPFQADSAFSYIQKQVGFGPRVPNTEAHKKCALFLENELKKLGAEVLVQEGEVEAFNRAKLQIKNIMGRYNPEKKERILLMAHWDTRPFADQDTKNQGKPISGANDGASGVAVLMEIARQINIKRPNVGVDIIFFDAEDYGAITGSTEPTPDSWCLGSQYWAKNMPIENYSPKYGILLDMVGAKNAVFYKEYTSMRQAPHIVEKVWKSAQKLGYSNYFRNEKLSQYQAITDDHVYVTNLTGIPTIDIIHYEKSGDYSGNFHSSWHTHNDNINIIDKQTLNAVGNTLLSVIFNE